MKNEKVEMVMKNDNLSKHALVFPFDCVCGKTKFNEMMCLDFSWPDVKTKVSFQKD